MSDSIQSLLVAFDESNNRFEHYDEHVSFLERHVDDGTMRYAVTLLTDDKKPIGTAAHLEFPKEEELRSYVNKDPYNRYEVWDKVNLYDCTRRPQELPRLMEGRNYHFFIGFDGIDENALERRLKVRQDHIVLGDELLKKGHILYGCALLNDKKEMCGSAFVTQFPTREELNKWLEKEPYVVGEVWKTINVYQCQIEQPILKLHKTGKVVR